MARDYKHRAHESRGTKTPHNKRAQTNGIGPFKWMLITALVISFAVFLVYLSSIKKPHNSVATEKTSSTSTAADQEKLEAAKKLAAIAQAKQEEESKKPQPPQFDFYTILPQKEVVVADHEIKTRAREERVGKSKETHYVIQAGSFKSQTEANQLRSKLALMGIESKVNKAKVGDVVWYRVKIGPYARLVSVKTVMERLQQNDMKPVVTEVDN